MHNLEREELAKLLNFHWDTLKGWEFNDVMPKPESVKILCEFFNVQLHYFHEYYTIYFNNPETQIRKWKEKNNLTYKQATQLLDITHSGFGRLINGKIKLSYDMYIKLKKSGAF